MVRALNYFFIAVLICVLVFVMPAAERSMVYAGLVASFIICSWAFLFGWLSRNGTFAAFIIGGITFGLGDWPTVAALLFFFISSTVISINSDKTSKNRVRRNGLQVWANGFWMVVWLVVGILTNDPLFRLASLGAIATATADTWATELGSRRFNVPTYDAARWQRTQAGSQGGVSSAGLLASLMGSSFIGLLLLAFTSQAGWAISIAAAGFIAALVDSFAGATLQGNSWSFPVTGSHTAAIHIDNNAVNFLATGFGSFIIIILIFSFT